MVQAENIDSRCSSFQLDDRSRRDHHSLAHRSKFPLSGGRNASAAAGPGRREATFCYGVLSHCYGESPAKGIVGTTLCRLSIISRLAF